MLQKRLDTFAPTNTSEIQWRKRADDPLTYSAGPKAEVTEKHESTTELHQG